MRRIEYIIPHTTAGEWSLRTDTWLEPQKSFSRFLLLPEMLVASINTFILSTQLTFPDSNLLNEKIAISPHL